MSEELHKKVSLSPLGTTFRPIPSPNPSSNGARNVKQVMGLGGCVGLLHCDLIMELAVSQERVRVRAGGGGQSRVET